MGLYYRDGSRVGGCAGQIGGLAGIIAVGLLASTGIGIGWAILIVIIAIIIIVSIRDKINSKND